MAIFPIVKGQKPNQTNAIPARGSVSAPSAAPPKAEAGAGDDLIDFGQSDAPVGKENKPEPAEATAPAKSGDVEKMLKTTGKDAGDGPLIDFHEDLKRDVPDLKRSSTEESEEFHDAMD